MVLMQLNVDILPIKLILETISTCVTRLVFLSMLKKGSASATCAFGDPIPPAQVSKS